VKVSRYVARLGAPVSLLPGVQAGFDFMCLKDRSSGPEIDRATN